MSTLFLSFMLFLYVEMSFACNGYMLRMNRIQNCPGGNDLIKLQNIKVTLDNNCILSAKGCLDVTKDYNKAQLHGRFTKAPVLAISIKGNVCGFLKDELVNTIFKLVSMPRSCPVKKSKICLTNANKVNIARYKDQINLMEGTADLKLNIDHDSDKTCMDINYTLIKK